MDCKSQLTIDDLKDTAHRARVLILKTVHNAGCGHTGGSLSEVEILTVLFFRELRIDPANPGWPDRDRFILSKGHSTPGYYATLALRGFFPVDELKGFDSLGSILQGHPDMLKTPGVDMSSGSLGQGLSCAAGMAMGAEANGQGLFTYVLLGDGECQEGQVWEAAMYAGVRKVRRLIAIVDYNKVQLASRTCEAVDIEPFADKWRAFGWGVLECDGHDMAELVTCLDRARNDSLAGPKVVIAHTVKGKGVSFMENQWQWHGKAPDNGQFIAAMKELGEDPEVERWK